MGTVAYACPGLASVSEINSVAKVHLGRKGFLSSYSLQFHPEGKSGRS